jgi:NHLM bacteriocin system ABC transporter ATP-binding protein
MSEADRNVSATEALNGRITLDSSVGPLKVIAGAVDVFVESDGGELIALATCEQNDVIIPCDGSLKITAMTRLGGQVVPAGTVDAAAVSSFTDRLNTRLGSLAAPLSGATPESFAGLFTAVARSAIEQRHAQLVKSAHDSRIVSEQFLDAAMDRAVYSAQTLRSPIEGFDVDPLVAVMQVLGKTQNFNVSSPTFEELRTAPNRLRMIAHRSNLRFRTIQLPTGWEQESVTPFLGFLADTDGTESPVALVRRGRNYTIQGPKDVSSRRMTADEVSRLNATAIEFYTPFEADRPATLRDVVRVALVSTKSSWVLTLAMAVGVTLFGLITPILTNAVIGTFIPQDRKNLIISAGVALIMAAVGIFVFSMVQNFAISRTSQLSTRNLQSAFWDRLISLPAEFFRNFNSGELAVRALAIDNLSSILSVQVVSSILTAFFGILYVVEMIYYDAKLGIAGLLFLLLTFVVLAWSFNAFNKQQTAQLNSQMDANGWLVQMLNGLSKIRIANAENRLVAKYIESLRKSIVAQSKVTVIGGWLSSWFVFAAVAAPALFYFVVYRQWTGDIPPITTATYLAFYSAFSIAFGAIAGLSTPMASISTVTPMYRLLKPMMEALPETSGNRHDPGELTGRIELRDVQFRYAPDSPLILRGLTMSIEPGELVALVGRTGAGKSTITRLLLAFEQPEEGQILFDGQDLASLDPTLVRHQMGVVMQSGRITRATVLKNIMGDLSTDEDTAWAAAEAAAVADDIRAMPMGMHTLVDPSNISGGQAQRLLIARSLVTKPRIVIMDEATSALDNSAQAQVTEAVGQLNATRIVIAHRLSTIRSADRIIVLDQGTAVQSGTYDELMQQEGLFVELVKRQVA